VAVDGDTTCGRRDRPCDAAENGRLAGAVRPAQGEPFAARKREIEVVYDLATAEAPPEALDQKRGITRGKI
jgi:hypothetical protein